LFVKLEFWCRSVIIEIKYHPMLRSVLCEFCLEQASNLDSDFKSLRRIKQSGRENVAGRVTKGGLSPTEVANPVSNTALQGAAFSGDRGPPIGSGFFTPMRNGSLRGRHVTDCQMRLYRVSD
jgi:hypothetical protein